MIIAVKPQEDRIAYRIGQTLRVPFNLQGFYCIKSIYNTNTEPSSNTPSQELSKLKLKKKPTIPNILSL